MPSKPHGPSNLRGRKRPAPVTQYARRSKISGIEHRKMLILAESAGIQYGGEQERVSAKKALRGAIHAQLIIRDLIKAQDAGAKLREAISNLHPKELELLKNYLCKSPLSRNSQIIFEELRKIVDSKK